MIRDRFFPIPGCDTGPTLSPLGSAQPIVGEWATGGRAIQLSRITARTDL